VPQNCDADVDPHSQSSQIFEHVRYMQESTHHPRNGHSRWEDEGILSLDDVTAVLKSSKLEYGVRDAMSRSGAYNGHRDQASYLTFYAPV